MSNVTVALCAVALLAIVAGCAYMKRPGMPWYEAKLTDTAIHGEYVGISPILASRGASLEESTVRFAIDGTGVFLDEAIEFDGSRYAFRTHYPPSWVFQKRGFGVDHALAVRQHASSTLAAVIIDFTSRSTNGVRSDAVMILGEGMPAPLGVFVRRRDGSNMKDELVALHTAFFTPAPPQVEPSWLQPIDIAAATITMTSGTVAERLRILKDASSNLWTGTDLEISERLSLIAMGLQDAEPEVQKEALEAFVLGGRVTGGVALVTEFLATHRMRRGDVVATAIEAATCLLFETHSFNKDARFLVNELGVSEPGAVHRKTGGRLTPAQHSALQRIAQSRPQRRWTQQHQRILREAIAETITDKDTPLNALREGERALQEYPLADMPQ